MLRRKCKLQAKKKKPAKKRASPKMKEKKDRISFSGFMIFFFGIVIGVMATILMQGVLKPRHDIGNGIKTLIEQSREQDEQNAGAPQKTEEPKELAVNYEFYAVLPGMEEVVADPKEYTNQNTSVAKTKKEPKVTTDDTDTSSRYMLQAGSYKSEADARNLKVDLALKGIRSDIQKVTIQGRGDFFRVRLGPFSSRAAMESEDAKLALSGIKALQLRVSN